MTVGDFEDVVETVGKGLVWSEDTEVSGVFVQSDDVTDEGAKLDHVLTFFVAVFFDFDAIFTEVRHTEVAEKETAIGMEVSADSGVSFWSEFADFWEDMSFGIE